MKKAVITGASSGIGKEFAVKLANLGYDLILVARRRDRLEDVANLCGSVCQIIEADLSNENEAYDVFKRIENDESVEILINNAGFGLFGEFSSTDLSRELEMIDVNIKAVHILTKLFLNKFRKNNYGYILNVASSASFLPGPLMSTYYSTKAYVQRLSLAINEELRREKSNIYVGAFCPGPVDTEFNDVANVTFAIKGITADFASEYAIKKMFKRKRMIIPPNLGFLKLIPMSIILKISYNIQHTKKEKLKGR